MNLFRFLWKILVIEKMFVHQLTISYFRLASNNFDTLSGLCPCMFGATIASNIQASVALLVSKCVSIFDKVRALEKKKKKKQFYYSQFSVKMNK